MSDIEEIHALTGRLGAAWAAGDATAYGAEYTEDADYVAFDGTHMKGRQAIVDVHKWLFDGPLKGSKIASSVSTPPPVRFLRSDVAVLISGGGVATADQPSAGQDSTQTTVLVKYDGRWLVAAFQNSRKSR